MNEQRWRPRPGETAEVFITRCIDKAQAGEVTRMSAALRERGYSEAEIRDAMMDVRADHATMKANALQRLAEMDDIYPVVAH